MSLESNVYKEDFLQSILSAALRHGGDYADIFLEETLETSIAFNDGKLSSISSGIVQGAGIRIIRGNNFIYLYTNDSDEKKLAGLAAACADAGKAGARGAQAFGKRDAPFLHAYALMPDSVDMAAKVEMVRRGDAAARAVSKEISQVEILYRDTRQNTCVATSEGRIADDERVRTRYVVSSFASRKDQKEVGFSGPGSSAGFEFFKRHSPESIAQEASRIALVMLDAAPAPTGTMPVIIDNGFGGVIFHEACGHALEATSVADDASVFCGKLGQKIAADCVTAIDDGTIAGEWGSASWDDEAMPTKRNVLIENGILKSYLVDRLGQAKMGLEANGCARKESYKFAPTSRMSNTYIAPGKFALDDLIASVDSGLYCRNMGGGSVQPATSDFNFAVSEAYIIKGGKLGQPVKNACLIGKGSEILMNIDMVADNMEFGTGNCGSSSGMIPANVGQAAIRVHGLVVGGKA